MLISKVAKKKTQNKKKKPQKTKKTKKQKKTKQKNNPPPKKNEETHGPHCSSESAHPNLQKAFNLDSRIKQN